MGIHFLRVVIGKKKIVNCRRWRNFCFVFICFKEKKEKDCSCMCKEKKISVFCKCTCWNEWDFSLDLFGLPLFSITATSSKSLSFRRCGRIPIPVFPAGTAQKQEGFSTLGQLCVPLHPRSLPKCAQKIAQDGSSLLTFGLCTRHSSWHCNSRFSMGKGSKNIVIHCRNLPCSVCQCVEFLTIMPPVPFQTWHGQWASSSETWADEGTKEM